LLTLAPHTVQLHAVVRLCRQGQRPTRLPASRNRWPPSWDEFGLGSRALDLVALALGCERRGDHAAADRLLTRAAQVAGDDGLRCLVSYGVIGGLAVYAHERQAYGHSLGDAECAAVSAILDRLPAAPDSNGSGPQATAHETSWHQHRIPSI
jgi:hypothetical protein